MKLLTLSAILFLSSFLTAGRAQKSIRFSDKRWKIESRAHIVEYYKGFECLYLKEGTATLADAGFLNGVIEFDICLTEQMSFSGFFFRQTSPGNYEDIYFRSHLSGKPDAFQYTPVVNGNAGWQLYHDQYEPLNDGFTHWQPRGIRRGFNGVIEFPFDKWLHVKLLVKDGKAELYFNNNNEPVAFIHELLHEKRAGGIGVASRISAMRFANFSYVNTDDIRFKTEETIAISTPLGTVTGWQFSQAMPEERIKKMNVLDIRWLNALSWRQLPAETTGLVNLSRLSAVGDSTNTILAKLTIVSGSDQLKRIDLGYSERIRVYCNGTVLYSGNAGFRTRDYRYLGTIGYFDAVYLPLKKGENTIIMAVSETFGGWGLMGKWENEEGISVKK